MKTRIMSVWCCLLSVAPIYSAEAPRIAMPQVRATEPAVVNRGPHHKRIEWTTVDEVGLPHKHGYTVVETGLHYLDEQGQYQEAKNEIELFQGAAIFRQAQHKIIFPADISNGVIDLLDPRQQRMTSRPVSLSYFDPGSGQVVRLATIKSSVGQLVGQNKIIYPDCFAGEPGISITADAQYIATKGAFSQDIVIRPSDKPFPSPSDVGLSDDSAHLVVMTEFFTAPEPEVTATGRGAPDWGDHSIDFGTGAMRMEEGRAFLDQGPDNPASVSKSWITMAGGRRFLVEALKYSAAKPALDRLQQGAAIRVPRNTARTKGKGRNVVEALASIGKLPAVNAVRPARDAAVIRTASLDRGQGYRIDYNQINSSQTNMVFVGNGTYYVSGSLTLYQTTTFEDGTAIKFAENSSVKMTVNGPVVCPGSWYRPAVFTSVNDNSVGEGIGNGSPSSASGATYLSDANSTTTNEYRYMRFCYAGVGLETSTEVAGVWHSQFAKCATAIKSTGGHAVSLYNVLMAQCTIGLNVSSANAYGQQVTIDQASFAVTNASAGYFTNCLVTSSTGTNTMQLYSSYLGGNSGIFAPVGGADYYLATNSTNCNIGSTNINPTLLANLGKLTVFAPLVYSNDTISTTTTLSPQAARDSDTPDRGYHYPPLDYVFGGTDANSNLTFTAGTAVGWFRTSSGFYHSGHGLHMADKQIVSFEGTVDAPCHWIRCNAVQETVNGKWPRGAGTGGITSWADQYSYDVTLAAEIHAKFTQFSQLSWEECHYRDDYGYIVVRLSNCEIYNGSAAGYINSHFMTNCLFNRVYMSQNAGWPGNEFGLRNCTFVGGYLEYNRYASAMPVSIRDTVFDNTSINVADGYASNPTYTDYSNNAFLTNGSFSSATNLATDVFVSSFNWQTSWLGRAYLPTNSTLINAGSQNSTNAGLYHFTVLTNQVKETNTTVDIGYHYVAVDGNGVPIDTDSDGTPDYIEDWNGNRSVDSGETDWESADDLGLRVYITRPRRTSPLP